jgi:hypothetical protein
MKNFYFLNSKLSFTRARKIAKELVKDETFTKLTYALDSISLGEVGLPWAKAQFQSKENNRTNLQKNKNSDPIFQKPPVRKVKKAPMLSLSSLAYKAPPSHKLVNEISYLQTPSALDEMKSSLGLASLALSNTEQTYYKLAKEMSYR